MLGCLIVTVEHRTRALTPVERRDTQIPEVTLSLKMAIDRQPGYRMMIMSLGSSRSSHDEAYVNMLDRSVMV